MLKLDDLKWQMFRLEDIFNISATQSSIDKKNLIYHNGTIPYITRTDKNNGIDCFVREQPKYNLDEGNVITIGLDTQTVFYQSVPFYTGQNIQVLRHPRLNRYIASFLLVPIKNIMVNLNWGGNGATLTRLRRSRIFLPSINGEPAWNFMEKFMHRIEAKLLETSMNVFKNRVNVNKCSLEGLKWRSFKLVDLFDFTKGNQNNMATLTPGDIPLVSARKCDNGYKGFISPNGKNLFDGDMITLNLDGDGGAGIAFYQPSAMALDSHVGALRPKIQMNRYHQIFIAMCLTNQGDMFGHGYSINNNRVRSLKIMLPVTSDNEIAWQFIDNYMRNIESTQIYEYISHIRMRTV